MPGLLLALDPGAESTGYALFNPPIQWRKVPPFPVDYGLWQIKRGPEWEWKVWKQGQRLFRMLHQTCPLYGKIQKVCCEMPIFFGFASPASESVAKLSFMVGVFGGIAVSCGKLFELIPVGKWKGQLPKAIACRRIRKLYQRENLPFDRDEWDAVGIGLHSLGFKI